MKTFNRILLLIMLILLYPLLSQEKEIIGKILLQEIDKSEVLIFEVSNSKYEVTGKLVPMLKSFYLNQSIKVKGNITNFPDTEAKQKKLNGKIEIKEIIITIQ